MRTELILEIIQERWSPYSFSQAPVEDFKLKAMFEAAGLAPSSRNEQPWLFVYATRTDSAVFNDFVSFLDESNQVWAREAWALIISMARTTYSRNGKLNRYAFHDTGMAVSNLLMQATAHDVYVHQMGGFSSQAVKDYLSLPAGVEPIAVMAAGYLGDGNNLPPDLQKRDEERRPRKQVNDYTFRSSLRNPAF